MRHHPIPGPSAALVALVLSACAPAGPERLLGPEFRINRGGALEEPAIHMRPAFATDGRGTVYAAWSDTRGGEQADVWMAISRDGGLSWGKEDLRLDTDEPTAARSHFVNLVCEGDRVYAFWRSKQATDADRKRAAERLKTHADPGPTPEPAGEATHRGAPAPANPEEAVAGPGAGGDKFVLFRASADGGATWGPIVRLNSTVDAFRISAAAAPGGRVAALWDDERTTMHSLWYNASADGGKTWLPADVRVDVPTADQRSSALEPALQIEEDGHVYAAWQERIGGNDCTPVFRSSTDGGVTWEENMRIPTSAVFEFATAPSLHLTGPGRLLLLWSSKAQEAGEGIRLNWSDDHGATWLTAPLRLDADSADRFRSLHPDLAFNGKGQVVAAWHDRRSGMADVYVNRSSDGGRTWEAEDTRLDGESEYPGDFDSEMARVAMDDQGRVVVVWQDARDGYTDTWASWSLDSGATWLTDPVRVERDEAGAARSLFPQVLRTGEGKFLIAWADYREGYFSLYGRILDLGSAGAGR